MKDNNRIGYLEGIISIAANLILFGLKYWAGIVTGSLALMADAWHTLSDSASSVIVIGSVRLSTRKPDTEHPFGHGRYQQIGSIFIAFLLGIVAYEFFTESISKIQSREATDFGLFAILVTALSVIVKEGLAQFAFYSFRKTGFESLKADGWHHRSDALSSLVVLVGIILGNRFWWIDASLGIIISIMLLYAVFEIVRDSVDNLLGKKPDDKLIKEIIELVSRVSKEEVCPHHFHLHTYGDHREITFHILLDGSVDIESGHEAAHVIERVLREEMGIEATIHIEPTSKLNHK